MELPDYLTQENVRNHRHGQTYTRLVRKAFGADVEVVIGHHITIVEEGKDPNEIPSADALLFCSTIMRAAFGGRALSLMARLAVLDADERERLIEAELESTAVAA
jgi:hypothetical protein